MYGSKKKLNMYLLEILRENTDLDNGLTQQKIVELLKQKYEITCDRRTVKSHIDDLKDMGWEIGDDKGYKLLEREFDDAELRILIDNVLFSGIISQESAKGLVEKLKDLGSKYFKDKIKHICYVKDFNHAINKQFMSSVDVINNAIAAEKKIQCIYNEIGTDFKLHPKKSEPYIINPYQMVVSNGKCYLIGNIDKYNEMIHLRVDKMTDVRQLEEKRKSQKELEDLAKDWDLPKHMAEHIYMFSGKSDWAEIKTKPEMMTTLVDWFGRDFKIEQQGEDYIVIRVKCNLQALKYWSLQYGPKVELLKPVELRHEIKKDIEEMRKKYKD